MIRKARDLAGVVLLDLPRYARSLMLSGEWLRARNRHERIEPAPDANGFRCDWKWTSDLHAARVIPALGRGLMRRAVADHPIERKPTPSGVSETPQVSFLIGHRGAARLPHLRATIECIAAQRGAAVECVVIEQDVQSRLANELPPWVRLVHSPADAGMPYCRSWSFNIGALHARAPVLVLHDNDMLVPSDYASQIVERVARGFDAVNLKRFVFYLTASHTDAYLAGHSGLLDAAPETVVQNLEAGGSVAITRDAFERIGGMDESFVGWGGEDNEFWERAATLKVWPWANLPIVHLWHAAQTGKQDASYATAQRYRELSQVDPAVRIDRLRALPRGQMSGPCGWRQAA